MKTPRKARESHKIHSFVGVSILLGTTLIMSMQLGVWSWPHENGAAMEGRICSVGESAANLPMRISFWQPSFHTYFYASTLGVIQVLDSSDEFVVHENLTSTAKVYWIDTNLSYESGTDWVVKVSDPYMAGNMLPLVRIFSVTVPCVNSPSKHFNIEIQVPPLGKNGFSGVYCPAGNATTTPLRVWYTTFRFAGECRVKA